MRLDAHRRADLDLELSQLRHQTRAERELWGIVRRGAPVPRRVVRDLAEELGRMSSATPTPTERHLIGQL